MSASIADTQAALVALIAAEATVTSDAIPVIDESRAGILEEVKTALGTKGICVVVYDPTDGSLPKKNIPVILCDTGWIVEVIEAPKQNRGTDGTGKWAWEIAAKVVSAIHGRPNGQLNPNHERGQFLVQDDEDGKSFSRLPIPGENVYQIYVTTGVAL